MLGSAVYSDIRTHRIPNLYLALGVVVAMAGQLVLGGLDGLLVWAAGLVVGLLCFLPLYLLGGMAAGDVKLMAVAGSYLGATGAWWAAVYSLLAGGVLGVLFLLYKKQLLRFLQRYWAIASLRTYIAPPDDAVARQRFPYSSAILLGSLVSACLRFARVGG
ncbi:prepilin peptidase [Pseudomonas sp. N040]|nr:prepilin peptidase [Pseudomonas sp. N040]MBW7012293.1 prepilin peptidase [Pseudomonas sp. N040]